MKTAFVIPARDKIHGVSPAVKSVLAQTYSPMELIFSDQGSTDGTRETIQSLCDSYDGKNKIRILDCPHTELKGMNGLNTHINWIMDQTDADYIILGSADDVNDATRAEKVVQKFDETGAAMVNTAIQFVHIDGKSVGTDFPTESRFVTAEEVMTRYVGGSTSPAWRHDFSDKIGALKGPICSDVYMPYLATQDTGLYYIHDLLYCLVRWPDKNNTGLGGRQLAAETEDEILQLRELVQYQMSSTFREIYKSCERLYPKWSNGDRQTLYNYTMGTAHGWSEIRDQLTEKKIVPQRLPA